MQTLVIFVALICHRMQIALPLATSYDYDFHHDGKFADFENILQQHHVRHRPLHLRSSHHTTQNIRHQRHIEMKKSESAAIDLLTQSATQNKNVDAENSNTFQHHLYRQHQYKPHHRILGLQPENKLDVNVNHPHPHHHSHDPKQQKEQSEKQQIYQQHKDHNNNSFHTQRTHAHVHQKKNVLKSRTTTMAAETETTTAIVELVKPTSSPTAMANVSHTIKYDEVNKSMQNYSHQPIIRQPHKQYGHQLHHNHHQNQQLKSDLSETKHTIQPSVNSFQQNLPITSQHANGHYKQQPNATLWSSVSQYTDNHKNQDGIDNNSDARNATASDVVVGVGNSENIIVMTSESGNSLGKEEDAVTNSEKAIEYSDDESEYYDYSSDDDSNIESRDYQNAAAIDVGYDYDSETNDDDDEWLVHKAENLNNDHQEHLRRSQEQQIQSYKHHKQHKLEAQNYRNEHFRVARDHHRVQSQQLGHNHLSYDTRSDDEYPDDEPYRDSTEQFSNRPGDLTFQKYRELGTMQAVQQSRDAYIQRQKSPSDLATEHINRMKVAARCSRPLPRVFHVSNDTSKTYVPSCTILHRCGEDTGCCRSMGQVCTVKAYEDVPLHFIVIQVNSSNSRRQTEIEILYLRNDTECHCVNRTDLTSAPEFNTRDKRSGFATRRHTQMNFNALDSQNQLMNRNNSEEYNENEPDAVCHCPKHFDVFQEDIRWEKSRQRHVHQSFAAQTFNCRCDCADATTTCQRFKNGEEGFAMDDRRCIADKICSVPNCSYGIFNEQMGRCPRPSRKHKRHNSGFG